MQRRNSWKYYLGVVVPHNDKLAITFTHILAEQMYEWSRPLIDGPQEIGFDTSHTTTAGVHSDPHTFLKDFFPRNCTIQF